MQEKDTTQDTASFKGHEYSGQEENAFYAKHISVSVIAKKTEKIATAIYMVTDFISESEPLRIQLRTLSLSLVSGTRKLSSRSSEPHYAFADEVCRTVDDVIVYLNLATTIGMVSEMNGKILNAELSKIGDEIRKNYGEKKVSVTTHPGYANIILTPAMFEVKESEKLLTDFPKGQQLNKGQTVSDTVLYEKKSVPAEIDEPLPKKTDIGTKIARRNDVLNIVRSKGKVSIKDISLIIKETSEKTIQRELLNLVREGALVKEGEKRWSLYRIA